MDALNGLGGEYKRQQEIVVYLRSEAGCAIHERLSRVRQLVGSSVPLDAINLLRCPSVRPVKNPLIDGDHELLRRFTFFGQPTEFFTDNRSSRGVDEILASTHQLTLDLQLDGSLVHDHPNDIVSRFACIEMAGHLRAIVAGIFERSSRELVLARFNAIGGSTFPCCCGDDNVPHRRVATNLTEHPEIPLGKSVKPGGGDGVEEYDSGKLCPSPVSVEKFSPGGRETTNTCTYLADNQVEIMIIKTSASALLSNPGASMRRTFLPSRMNSFAGSTPYVYESKSLTTILSEPLASLINWWQVGEVMVIVAKRTLLTIDFPAPLTPMTLFQRLGCRFNKRAGSQLRTRSRRVGLGEGSENNQTLCRRGEHRNIHIYRRGSWRRSSFTSGGRGFGCELGVDSESAASVAVFNWSRVAGPNSVGNEASAWFLRLKGWFSSRVSHSRACPKLVDCGDGRR